MVILPGADVRRAVGERAASLKSASCRRETALDRPSRRPPPSRRREWRSPSTSAGVAHAIAPLHRRAAVEHVARPLTLEPHAGRRWKVLNLGPSPSDVDVAVRPTHRGRRAEILGDDRRAARRPRNRPRLHDDAWPAPPPIAAILKLAAYVSPLPRATSCCADGSLRPSTRRRARAQRGPRRASRLAPLPRHRPARKWCPPSPCSLPARYSPSYDSSADLRRGGRRARARRRMSRRRPTGGGRPATVAPPPAPAFSCRVRAVPRRYVAPLAQRHKPCPSRSPLRRRLTVVRRAVLPREGPSPCGTLRNSPV